MKSALRNCLTRCLELSPMSKKSTKDIAQDKEKKIMDTVAWYAAYYRANPQRFVKDILCIDLHWFQSILIWAMMHYNYFDFIASRGIGKSFLTAVFCVCRCVLYPGTKVVVVSGTLKQANEVLLKIQDELMPKSAFLRQEIKKCTIGVQDAEIIFWNGSWIRTRPSTDNARGNRANLLICDEFRMIDPKIRKEVLQKMGTVLRQPGYLSNPEYKNYPRERNKEIYMSSAYFKSSWAYKLTQDYTVNLLDDKRKYFVCGLPYQLGLMEGMFDRGAIEDEMSESNFNQTSFDMEMGCMWFGDDGDSLFKYEEVNRCRRIEHALLPLKYYNQNNPVPKVSDNGERILSVDVALMASTKRKKNDASAIFINELVRQDNVTYKSNFCYAETMEDKTTDEVGLAVMRYFYNYKCTYLVLDTNGLGIGVYDFIIKDQYDPETGQVYKAMTCVNDEEMAKRCKIKDANKVVYSVKANPKFNNDICVLLRNGIQNGKIDFLIDETECDTKIEQVFKKYKALSTADKALIKNPYMQTTLMVYELIKLEHEIKGSGISVREVAGMRKDRYSSVAYNFWCACQLELGLKPSVENTQSLLNKFLIRPAKHNY